jgi:hypothetical protein
MEIVAWKRYPGIAGSHIDRHWEMLPPPPDHDDRSDYYGGAMCAALALRFLRFDLSVEALFSRCVQLRHQR